MTEELLVLGRPMQRRQRRLTRLHHLRDLVEVTGSYFALVLDRGEPTLGRCKFALLQLDERSHVLACVTVREIEHRIVERMESCESDELELVTHGPQLTLELRDRGVVEMALPVERWRAV